MERRAGGGDVLGYAIPDKLGKEIGDFAANVGKKLDGTADPQSFKAQRVPFGVYEQRKSESYMVRIRCAAGIITPAQLERTALLAQEFGNAIVHVTTRQELQVHDVEIRNVIHVLNELKAAGLSTRGGGGNTVRNITAPADSGIAPGEVFDVSPHAVALTSRLIAEDDSWTLPRKYKIAFAYSSEDTSYATVSDLGFIARLKDGRKGFRVYGAGGMGAKPAVGKMLFDFIPEADVYAVAAALKALFHAHGNRKNRHSARLRFLWEKLGEARFLELLKEEFERVKKSSPGLEITEIKNTALPLGTTRVESTDRGFTIWRKRYAQPQKQEGLFSVLVPLKLGDIPSQRALALAGLFRPLGENCMRATHEQNLLLRNIPAESLPRIYGFLKNTFPEASDPAFIGRTVTCTGASTCKLGICLSRELAKAVFDRLGSADWADELADTRIHISGCPNSCGQHFIADIGLQGAAGRKGDHLYPAYQVFLGGALGDGATRFAAKAGEIPARAVPGFLEELLKDYALSRSRYPGFRDYLDHGGREIAARLLEKHRDVPGFDRDKNYYFDWGAQEKFTLAKRGQAECSAGLFDFIERDMRNIEETGDGLRRGGQKPREELLFSLLFFSSRMLLITRGIEAGTPELVFNGFAAAFIDTRLISGDFRGLLAKAASGDMAYIAAHEHEVYGFRDAVLKLYESMDDSLNFPPQGGHPRNADERGVQPQGVAFKDLRGVACPMNFVKTKLELSRIKKGDLLEIFLDDGPPIENVPRSVEEEGHSILEQSRNGEFWKVLIRKETNE